MPVKSADWTYTEDGNGNVATQDLLGPKGGAANVATYATDANGNVTGLVDPQGNLISLGEKTTTLYTTATAALATGTVIDFTTTLLDENSAADLTNNVITVPLGKTHVEFTAQIRVNNTGSTTGTYRRLKIEMDDGTDTWGSTVPGCLCEMIYTTLTDVDTTILISSGKIPLSFLETLFGSQVTKFRCVFEHNAGSSLNLQVLGNVAGTPTAFMSASFFQ